jgi:hypothetical protein
VLFKILPVPLNIVPIILVNFATNEPNAFKILETNLYNIGDFVFKKEATLPILLPADLLNDIIDSNNALNLGLALDALIRPSVDVP